MTLKRIIKRLVPAEFLSIYHRTIALAGAIRYGFPASKMFIIGVTGTKGKSTIINLAGRILEEAGFRVGWISTLNIKIDRTLRLNPYHMTMLGRWQLQRLLARMLRSGCRYVLVEVTSEGVVQHRHAGINFDLAVYTGIHPEHIEAHGGFENYLAAKHAFFKYVAASPRKKLQLRSSRKELIPKTVVVNGDDEYAERFLSLRIEERYAYLTAASSKKIGKLKKKFPQLKLLSATHAHGDEQGVGWKVLARSFSLGLRGDYNIANGLAALGVAHSQGIDLELIRETLGGIKSLEGRFELIEQGQPFCVIVDQAHTPVSLAKVYQTALKHHKASAGRLICVLGCAGGGRDRWKRPVMGEVAAKHCALIFLTNEDPYDEPPGRILEEIKQGIVKAKTRPTPKTEMITDRREAIGEALSRARVGDAVLITGKGAEQLMMLKDKKIPWDDREVVREELRRLGHRQ